jgi:hypothetical protein
MQPARGRSTPNTAARLTLGADKGYDTRTSSLICGCCSACGAEHDQTETALIAGVSARSLEAYAARIILLYFSTRH